MPGGFPLLAWGKPVQTNPQGLPGGSRRASGNMLVSLMGPPMNLRAGGRDLDRRSSLLARVVNLLDRRSPTSSIRYFLVLNIAPDVLQPASRCRRSTAARCSAGVLPPSLQIDSQTLQRYGTIVFFVLLLSGALSIVMRPGLPGRRVRGPGRAA